MDHRPHIVVVEDENTQRNLLVDYLARQKFRVTGVDGGIALRRLVERELPALVLLDVGLPGEDGFALARWLREKSGRIGIIMVTVASDTVDRVVGLETGADDYIAKPFEPRELLARVKSVLRRSAGGVVAAGPRVRMGRRVLDLERRVLVDPADNSEETLTASEFDLLKVFAENPNRPLQRDWLLEVTAHREMEAFDRAVDLRITRLRRKIEPDPAHPDAIRTVRGVGYMFRAANRLVFNLEQLAAKIRKLRMTSRAAYLVGARIKRRCAAPQQQPALRAQVGGSKNSEYCANWRSPGN
jgi:DNA-binding response OmpR family regulator